tara:strand:+ start:1400 stop:2137 length:738 start_codon:yes stop_codon:yes gene_type:complete
MFTNKVKFFKNKKILITGFSSGIGKKTCLELLKMGATLILVGRKKNIFKDYKNTHFFEVDLNEIENLKKKIQSISKKFKKIDGFVHSAAQNQSKNIDKISVLDWTRIINVNLTSAFIICKELKKNFKRSKKSSIVLISSIAGHRKSVVSGVHYVASKSGIIGLTKQLSHEFGKEKIRINCISPSQTLTPMLKKSMTKNQMNSLQKNIPLQRFAETQEQSNVIIFLLSELSSYIHGTSINVDGGQL